MSDSIIATYRYFRDVLASNWRVNLNKGFGSYKAIPDEMHDFVNKSLGDHLKDWGYEI